MGFHGRAGFPAGMEAPAWALRIGVGKALRLPSLRTARAVFPHTALRSEVSSSGLN